MCVSYAHVSEQFYVAWYRTGRLAPVYRNLEITSSPKTLGNNLRKRIITALSFLPIATIMVFSLARLVVAILILPTSITAQCYTNGRVRENSGCQYKCHCEGDVACDRDTGACQGKCDPQWFGSACQYGRINLLFLVFDDLGNGDDDDDDHHHHHHHQINQYKHYHDHDDDHQNHYHGCQYKCHCEGDEACDRNTGACQGKCDPQWLGPACQYASLNFAPSEQLAWLTDNDDGTCNDGRSVQSITVRLDTPQRVNWVRVVVNESDHLRQFQLTYRTESSRGFSSCPSGQSAKVNDLTLDISCPTMEVVSELKLSGSGVTALCSLYISDDTFINWYSRNAVDGDPGVPDSSPSEFEQTCTHTPSYRPDGWWRVMLSNAAAVFRIVIYNRRWPSFPECCEDRLIGFTLEAFNQTSTRVFTYTDPNPTAQQIYTVIVPANITDPINRIRISNSKVSEILTLCEVLVFGETVCPSGKFGLKCERDCNCEDRQESCFVSTGGCPSGCASGYTGEDCYTRAKHPKLPNFQDGRDDLDIWLTSLRDLRKVTAGPGRDAHHRSVRC
ncbi:fucolectin-related protein [Plakobranchus ocellatus]|uniref:Fucolectin-related protein n=1 Tax=Plakobranchus ocellatus TaxID=259542 RepID=A0AAV4A2X9_9GAST|nr:fucolectin-related protein [Plakobranchus ocellatus]